MTQSVDLQELSTLITLNSHTLNKAGVDKNAEQFNQWMQALGFEVTTFEREQIGNHVHYTSPKKEGRKLLLLGHLDTVFPEKTFNEFREDDKWVYGPGVCDMKGGNHIALQSLRNIFNKDGAISNIDMFLVSDEETGSDDSKAVTREVAQGYDLCMVFEAAGPNHDVVVARKGVATFHIFIQGKAAHAGNCYTEGVNANLVAAQMLIDLTNLTDLEKGTTVNVGLIKGGMGANTISPSAKLTVEARFKTKEECERILTTIPDIAANPILNDAKVSIEGGLQRDVMMRSEVQAELIKEFEQILGYPLILEERGGVSDANIVSGQGVPTIDGWGPFGDGDHTIHERASKSSFIRRTEEVTKILGIFNGK